MERKIQESLIDQKTDGHKENIERVEPEGNTSYKVVIGLLVVAIVLLICNIALGAYNMTKNKTGIKKVNNFL